MQLSLMFEGRRTTTESVRVGSNPAAFEIDAEVVMSKVNSEASLNLKIFWVTMHFL
jgi:hypothetical protein